MGSKTKDLQEQLKIYQLFGQEAGDQYSALSRRQRAALGRLAQHENAKREQLFEQSRKRVLAAETKSIWTKEFRLPFGESVFGLRELSEYLFGLFILAFFGIGFLIWAINDLPRYAINIFNQPPSTISAIQSDTIDDDQSDEKADQEQLLCEVDQILGLDNSECEE